MEISKCNFRIWLNSRLSIFWGYITSTSNSSTLLSTEKFVVLKALYACFPTRRVCYMFASNMPNSLPLLIHSFNFSFNHKPQAISVIYTPNCVITVSRSQLNWSYANFLLVCFKPLLWFFGLLRGYVSQVNLIVGWNESAKSAKL